jgi:hypothetical protein
MGIICDRCGREMNDHWEIEGMPGAGGNCSSCGDDLCAECAGKWSDDGDVNSAQRRQVNDLRDVC